MKRLLFAFVALLILSSDAIARTESHTFPACGTSTTLALAANTARTYAILNNISDTAIHVAVGEPATLNHIKIIPNGSWEIGGAFSNATRSAVNCIHAGSGTKNLSAYEIDLRN